MNFGVSARLGSGRYFVIEADEYDTAFFDKRSKFVHYRPRTAILNNLEFDHADIFADLARDRDAVPPPRAHRAGQRPPRRQRARRGAAARARRAAAGARCSASARASEEPGALRARGEPHAFDVLRGSLKIGRVDWPLLGEHNQLNALAAIGAAEHVGRRARRRAPMRWRRFENVRRRLELRGEAGGVKVYDDFAHHPTAIRTTVDGLRRRVGLRSASWRCSSRARTP